MPDPTLETLELFSDPANWDRVVENVPVFKPHRREVKDGSGKVVRVVTVTPADLPEIAAASNALEASGVVGRGTLGHIRPDLPETQQPPVVVYFRRYRVGTFGPKNEPAILATMYVKKGRGDAIKGYPFRSAEYYPSAKEIRGVAFLKRDAALELGTIDFDLLNYSASEPPLYFAVDAAMPEMPDEKKDKPEPKEAPAAPPHAEPDGDELSPEEAATADRYMAHYRKRHPFISYAMKCYEASAGAAAGGPAMPSGTNGTIPADKPAESEGQNMQHQQQAEHYERLRRENEQTKAQVAALQKRLAESDVKALLNDLRDKQGVRFDYARELAAMVPMTGEQRAAHVQYMKTYYGTQEVEVYSGPVESPEDGKYMSEQRAERAIAYMREHPGCGWDEAVAKTK